MEEPKIPENEPARLQALEKLNLLDTPLQENFERITRITQALFKMPIVAFTLVDKDRQWFKSIQGFDVCETTRRVSFCGHVINQDGIFIVNDTLLDPRFCDNPLVLGEPNIRFYAGYPVRSKDGLKVGTLCLIDMQPRHFTEKDLLELKDMVTLIENELNNTHSEFIKKELTEELARAKRQALVDGLTRLWNRSGLEALIKEKELISVSNHENFGLALIDIDNFKSVNDTFGHNAGDAILRGVAKRLLSSYRSSDNVGRWGGEEFLVILDKGDEGAFFEAAERAREAVSATPIIYENLEITITVTTGVANFDWKEPKKVINLISEADTALYDGKSKGKNVVKISFNIKENKKVS